MIRYVCDYELARATPGSSGYDLRNTRSGERTMQPGERWLFETSLYLAMDLGVEAQVRSRSGMALGHGVIVLNAPGTIDSDYRGEVKVLLFNSGNQPYLVRPGDRIAQLVFAPVMTEWRDGQPHRSVDHVLNPRSDSGMSLLYSEGRCNLRRETDRAKLGDTERGTGGHGSTGV